ncbi:ADP-ribosylglycohydrolase-domain-containing protein [Dactylonectria estremocensis]|uniref:ADP-ribosylglycohydrolase-domain-containing protein n=1 Tax=Dactylonectria estremocensis TaxID=1079267 RepID=A0A9P9J217_9HYPO|nr:ADP-ribosylglycohydrolase-domain-containing protein [Dactylonectria estremocensis]
MVALKCSSGPGQNDNEAVRRKHDNTWKGKEEKTGMSSLPEDYLQRVYAGVLGKLVGVYLGRPFENWTYHEIQDRLGDIIYYVHDKLGVPLVVIDDDVSGTFAFVRALEEHGVSAELSSEEVGKTWLNQVIQGRSIFWWGGNGISTEHTAFLNLKKGIAAPESGAASTNGLTMAEQIGAQIFIDGWAMVAPGNPALAARFAEAAARVSHDGEAVHAAKLWAAMEAEAFVSKDVDHLLDVGLQVIPTDSLIARMIADVRQWVHRHGDWRRTRQQIEDNYGYDKYLGICHVIPNHAIMIMALLYGGHDFHKAMHIINTCGWDTDCNSGNVACLVALMHGLEAFEGGPDWLGPLADRAIISSADGGYSINNATRIAYDIANIGRQLSGQSELPPPKDGAQFHFTLPGSVQGFQVTASRSHSVRASQGQDRGIDCLGIHIQGLEETSEPVEVMTDTFTPLDVVQVNRNYELMASPLVYSGQLLRAELHAAESNTVGSAVCLRLKAYNQDDDLVTVDSSPIGLEPGQQGILKWTIPDSLQNWPIQQIGFAVSTTKRDPALNGAVFIHSLRWDGTPRTSLKRPADKSQSFWRRAWVSSVDKMHTNMGPSFFLAQDRGEGILSQGTRDWVDYNVAVSDFVVNFGGPMGVAARVQGLNRYYALVFTKDKQIALVKAADEKRIELASRSFDWKHDTKYDVHLTVQGSKITGQVRGVDLAAVDEDYAGGAVGLVVTDGSLGAESITVSPVVP